MKSRGHFSLWQIVPFPFLLNGTVLQLSPDMSSELVMLSQDDTYLSLTTYNVLSQCKTSFYNFYVCPAYPFVFRPVREERCALSLIQSHDDVSLRLCHFEPVSHRLVYHVHLLANQYFYFPNSTEVSLSCLSRPSFVRVLGYYTVADHCEVRTSHFVTFPNRQHLTLTANLSTVMSPIIPPFNLSAVNLTVVSEKL